MLLNFNGAIFEKKNVYKLLSAFFSAGNLLELDYLVVFKVKSVKKRVNTFLMQNNRNSPAILWILEMFKVFKFI